MKKILLISHELSLTGAPRMLFNAALAIRQAGWEVVILSAQDGALRSQLENKGFSVVLAHTVENAFIQSFDVILVNTVVMHQAVCNLVQANLSAKIIWWLHESQGILEHLPSTIDIPLLQSKVHILTVSRYAQSFLPQGLQSTILKNGIPDTAQLFRQPENPSAAFKFAWIGTLAPYKGADIFCNAIALLPENMREQCQFFIAGEPMLFLPDYFERIIQTAQTYPQLQYLGHLTHEAALNLMTQSNVIVSSSRDESFSLVCTEAAMLSKPIILNQNVGIADMFTHGESCLLHETENTQSLAAQMLWAYENRETAAQIGCNARKIFEQELTIEQFSQNFMQILQNEITA